MLKSQAIAQASKLGDFYMYYQRENGPGTAYLAGTTDFSTPYIQEKYAKLDDSVLKQAESEDKVLVFSWTANKFRTMAVNKIKRLVPLALRGR